MTKETTMATQSPENTRKKLARIEAKKRDREIRKLTLNQLQRRVLELSKQQPRLTDKQIAEVLASEHLTAGVVTSGRISAIRKKAQAKLRAQAHSPYFDKPKMNS